MRGFVLGASLALTACEGGLETLWQGPPPPARPIPSAAPSELAPQAMLIAGRMAVTRSHSVPTQIAGAAGERLNVSESAPLDSGLWVVRTRVPLPGELGDSPLAVDGRRIGLAELETILRRAPAARIGLRLDSTMKVLEDSSGAGRSGTLLSCDGDAVPTTVALRACLALAAHRGEPALRFRALPADPDAGPAEPSADTAAAQPAPIPPSAPTPMPTRALVDAGVSADAPSPAGGDGGVRP